MRLQVLASITDSGNALSSWSGLDPCVGTWAGVICTSGQVTGLSLATLGLSGSLPDALKWMVNLTSVQMASNSFGGTLPASWSALTALTYMSLQSNALTGTLPAAWSALTRLTYLNLAYNRLTATIPAAWAASSGMQVGGGIWTVPLQSLYCFRVIPFVHLFLWSSAAIVQGCPCVYGAEHEPYDCYRKHRTLRTLPGDMDSSQSGQLLDPSRSGVCPWNAEEPLGPRVVVLMGRRGSEVSVTLPLCEVCGRDHTSPLPLLPPL